MELFIAGAGKLANELLTNLVIDGCAVLRWRYENVSGNRSIVIHAGSGRELEPIMQHCAKTRSTLIELATGSVVDTAPRPFPVVLCPNTNLLMLKFMRMLNQSGGLYRGHRIRITESHQSEKTSVPGTAVNIAKSLGMLESDIHSIRDRTVQLTELGIPLSQLSRHAYHRIDVEDSGSYLSFVSMVHGDTPYTHGVSRVVEAVRSRVLEHRCYTIAELIDENWL